MRTVIERLTSAIEPTFSLELMPKADASAFDDVLSRFEDTLLRAPDFVSVTDSHRLTWEDTLRASVRVLGRWQVPVVPHIACKALHRRDLLAVAKACLRADIDTVLILRGDLADGERVTGDFAYASEAIAFLREEGLPLACGAACYPVPHPESLSREADRLALARKSRAGAAFFVSQLSLDPTGYADLTAFARAEGVTAPLLAGVTVGQSVDGLKRFCAMCGLASGAIDEAALASLPDMARAALDAGLRGTHVFTLNRPEPAREYARLLAERGGTATGL